VACWSGTADYTVGLRTRQRCCDTRLVRNSSTDHCNRLVCPGARTLARTNERMESGMGRTKPKTLTQGVVIFAFNNEATDYIAMAAWSAKNIRRHLNLPVAVVTDAPEAAAQYKFEHIIVTAADTGGSRHFADYNANVTWHNAGRINAYELSPFDQTLVLDADYVVASDALLDILKIPQQFAAFSDAFEPSSMTNLETFGEYRMPMWWATVMMFRRGTVSQYIFDSMQMIRANWQHYRDLYGIHQSNYRNDYALSIALGLVAGSEQSVHKIFRPMLNVMPDHGLTCTEQDHYEITYTNTEGRLKTMSWQGLDFHAMCKRHLEAIVAAS
jgi:hypothetical protein